MATARQQIREALIGAITGLATTGARCYATRAYPVSGDNMPCLRVMLERDAIVEQYTTNDSEWHDLSIVIEAIARASTDVDDTLDTICGEVGDAIASDDTLGGLVKWLRFDRVDFEISDDGDKPIGFAVMRYSAHYVVNPQNPNVLL